VQTQTFSIHAHRLPHGLRAFMLPDSGSTARVCCGAGTPVARVSAMTTEMPKPPRSIVEFLALRMSTILFLASSLRTGTWHRGDRGTTLLANSSRVNRTNRGATECRGRNATSYAWVEDPRAKQLRNIIRVYATLVTRLVNVVLFKISLNSLYLCTWTRQS
jgi:hypothetical protein